MKPDHTISQEYVRLSNRVPVRAQPVPTQPDYPPHDHEFYEICLIAGGRARHRTVEGDEWLERGSVVVVAPGQLHGFSGTARLSVVNVYYLAEWFLANVQALSDIDRLVPLFFQRALFPSTAREGVIQFKLTEIELNACLHDFAEVEAEAESASSEVLFLEAAFLKCLIRLSRAYARSQQHAPAVAPLSLEISRGLAAIERVVRTGEALDVAQVAKEAGLSFSHFCRLFKAATGVTAGAYFQRRRIHRACHRLLTTQVSATEVAHLLGYADSAHFNRRFKQTTGLTPLAYRKKFSAT